MLFVKLTLLIFSSAGRKLSKTNLNEVIKTHLNKGFFNSIKIELHN